MSPSQASTSALPSLQQPLPRVPASSLQYPPGHLRAVPDRTAAEGAGDNIINAMSYLTKILLTKVYDIAKETPLQLATKLFQRWGVNVWLKREDLQPAFSFKLRSAYNMMAKLPQEQLVKGVICSSAGNHAQGLAVAAKKLNCSAVIAMPVTTPETKVSILVLQWRSVERLGGTVILVGDSYDESQAYAKKRGDEEGRTFIPAFDHPDVIVGQGTIGMEIVRHIAAYVKRVFPEDTMIATGNGLAPQKAWTERIIAVLTGDQYRSYSVIAEAVSKKLAEVQE